MSQVDKQALREAAVAAKTAGETQSYYRQTNALNALMGRASPDVVIALLDENEALAAENERLKNATNEMQAQGVERCAAWIQGGYKYSRMAEMLREFAAKLREAKA